MDAISILEAKKTEIQVTLFNIRPTASNADMDEILLLLENIKNAIQILKTI